MREKKPNREIIAQEISLASALPPVLAVGAYLKNAVALIQGDQVWVSRDHGPLDNSEAIKAFEETAQAMIDMAHEKPIAVAHDWHPDFPCTRWAMTCGLPAIGVQHHHAHSASVMAEHGVESPTLGLALDGFGLGEHNEAWGGELLLVDREGFKRLGHLYPLHQPGGDLAARQPWRMGAAALFALGRGDEIASRFSAFEGAAHMAMMMQRGLNAPLTSSAGRLFDAACGFLGVKPIAAFEGEAPMALEAMVTTPCVDPQGWVISDDGVLDLRPLLTRLLDCSAQEGANLFHGTLAAALMSWMINASQQTGLKTFALSGGCFFNKVLCCELRRLCALPEYEGMSLLWPQNLSAGDGGLAVGQAWVAGNKIALKQM